MRETTASTAPKIGKWVFLLGFTLCLLCVFARDYSYLSLPFSGDDNAFLKVPLKRYAISSVPRRGLLDFLEVWNPNHGWFYRPTYLTYWMLMHKLGLTSAFIMHAVGLVLHATNIFLWGLLAFRVSRQAYLGLAAAAGAFLWPGGEEAILRIGTHSTLLGVLGVLVAANCWVSWRHDRGSFWYGAGLLSFWLGCCAKNDAAIGIVLFPLLDQFFQVGNWRERLKAYAPYLVVWMVYVLFEWHGARLYGLHSDPVYKAIADVPLLQRPHYVLAWLTDFTDHVIPIYPLTFLSVFCLPLGLVFNRVLRDVRKIADPRLLRTFTLAAGLAGAATLVPFVSTLQSTQSRLLYFPAFPFSLAVILIVSGAVWAAWQWKRIDRESGLSSAGIGLAICAVSVVFQPHSKINNPTLDSMLWLLLVGALGLCFRSQLLDPRVAGSLALAIVFRQVDDHFPIQSLNGWLFAACGAAILLWRRNWVAGVAMTYGAWLNPVLALGFLIGRGFLKPYEHE
ncbi:hypothetical protein EON80_00180 [bacterium]|nr:MAG: hypothetical protein EON80_00180 [bacterium]